MAKKKVAKSPDTDHPGELPAKVDANFNQVQLKATPTKLTDLSPDEEGYEVNGYLASVRWSRGAGAANHMFGITCCAYARDKDGKPYLKADGTVIEGAYSASCTKKDLLADPNKREEVKKAALDGALREMLAHIAENVAFESLGL